MLSVILFILKIIGIILASLLGLLLFILLLVLFVPIRYVTTVDAHENITAKVKVSWLCRILFFRASYEKEKFRYSLRLFGIELISERPKKKKIKRNKNKRNKIKGNKIKRKNSGRIENSDHTDKNNTIEIPMKKEKVEAEKIEVAHRVQMPDEKKLVADEKRKQSFLKTLKEKFRSIKQKIRDILRMVRDILRKVGGVKQYLFSMENREGFKRVYRFIKRVVLHIFPTKITANLTFGTGDPCSTGQTLGVICAIYPAVLHKVHIIPNFEEKVFEGDLYAKGRIRVFTLLVAGLKLVFDKDFKHLIHEFNNLKEEL